ncbi:MAG: hypothetical protein GY863_22870 [bacterium]|nr:hypothetical protein [bacterium]
MKKLSVCLIMILFCLGISFNVYGQEGGYEEPVLLTTAGQSADIVMTKVIFQRAGVQFTESNFAQTKDLKNIKTLVLVAGGSSKGLGAANIDKDKELTRVKELVAKAKNNNIKIITMHIGGKARRGKLSDPFNEIAGNASDYMVIVKTGNEDGFFTKIAESQNIPIEEIKGGALAIAVIEKLFDKK